MKKRILLVNPPVLAVNEPWFDEPKFVRTALAHLAGYLQHNDWEIRCLDASDRPSAQFPAKGYICQPPFFSWGLVEIHAVIQE